MQLSPHPGKTRPNTVEIPDQRKNLRTNLRNSEHNKRWIIRDIVIKLYYKIIY
jgi:hypothetical protein